MRRQVLLPLLAALWTTACSAPAGPSVVDHATVAVPGDAQPAVVVREVDGDTVVLRGVGQGPLGGRAGKVRLIGVDTPEVFAGARVRDVPQCFGEQASARTAALLPPGAHVRVTADRERRDRYGRTLLYVWSSDGRLVEEDLVRGGWGRVLVVGGNNRYADVLCAAEQQARSARRGLWAACTG